MTLDCLTCGEPYEQDKRRASHFCPDCRKARNRARDAERHREVRAAERTVRDRLDEYVELGMSPDYVQRYRDDLDDLMGGDVRVYASPADTVPDRMPVGANSPAGPNDGCSTGWKDLQETLDIRAREAAAHSWFLDNPHWSFALHDEDAFEAARVKRSA